MTKNDETQYEESVRNGELEPKKIMQYHVDNFNRGGGEKPVKVMPTEAKDRDNVSGFFTQEKFIKGSTPKQMEHDLGLQSGTLENGATIYEFTDTPTAEQFVPAGYTHMPGGRPYEEGGEYPVGSGVKQFELKEDVPAKVVGKVNYDEPWMGQSVGKQENEVRHSENNEPASKSIDQPSQPTKPSQTSDPAHEQNEEYHQGYGY